MPVYPMDFQPLSFQDNNPALAGMQSMGDILSKQIANQFAPRMNQQDLQQKQLANALAQINLQTAPQMNQADLAYKLSQARQSNAQAGYLGTEAGKNQFLINHPSLMLPGNSGNIAGLMYLQQQANQQALASQMGNNGSQNTLPSDNGSMSVSPLLSGGNAQNQQPNSLGSNSQSPDFGSMIRAAIQQPQIAAQAQQARTNYYNQKVQGAGYLDSTPTEKNYMQAQGVAFGYAPDEVASGLVNGKTLPQMAAEKGWGLDRSQWPNPDYAATSASINRNQQRLAAQSELNTIQPTITDALAPYAKKFDGYSIQQVVDSLNNEYGKSPADPELRDKLARFYAARQVGNEMNAIKARMAGQTNIGADSLRAYGDTGLNDFKILGPQIDPGIYSASQNYASKWLNQMVGAANKASLVPYINDQPQQQGDQNPLASAISSNSPNAGVSIPKFSNKNEFQSWYAQLPIDKQAAVRKQMGGS